MFVHLFINCVNVSESLEISILLIMPIFLTFSSELTWHKSAWRGFPCKNKCEKKYPFNSGKNFCSMPNFIFFLHSGHITFVLTLCFTSFLSFIFPNTITISHHIIIVIKITSILFYNGISAFRQYQNIPFPFRFLCNQIPPQYKLSQSCHFLRRDQGKCLLVVL